MHKMIKIICTAMLILVLPILWISCKSTQIETKTNPIQIETHFPSPYDENGNAIVQFDGENVSMPLWYWLKIVEYAIDTETNEELQK